jgi:tetratricopeptide (TPR) repeat protein
VLAPRPPSTGPESLRARLEWAATLTSRYGGPASRSTGEPVFSQLPVLTEALESASREGSPDEVVLALPLADVLGAAWERLGEHETGRARLDAILAAANRAGLRNDLAVARVLRRRARLSMGGRLSAEADEDLQRAYAIASSQDERLTVSLVLDRADLAMHRGAWDLANAVIPELLRRTEETGDPLLQAMGLNRAGWGAFGQGAHAISRQRYERAWSLAELHEDPVVEARTASGLGLLAMLGDEIEQSRGFWRRALELADQVHDRAFTLHCLDGIAALLVITGRDADGAKLSASVTAVRESLDHGREEGMRPLHDRVLRHSVPNSGSDQEEPWCYAEAGACARAVVA